MLREKLVIENIALMVTWTLRKKKIQIWAILRPKNEVSYEHG